MMVTSDHSCIEMMMMMKDLTSIIGIIASEQSAVVIEWLEHRTPMAVDHGSCLKQHQ